MQNNTEMFKIYDNEDPETTKSEFDEIKIEQICSRKGDLRFDGRCFTEPKYIFEVKEFIFVFYGNSRDRKSRLIAQALNQYIEEYSNKGSSSNGLVIKKGEVSTDIRAN